MADPIIVKVSELPELTDLAAGDLLTAVDISEAVSANKTKRLQAWNIKIFSTAQLADSIVTVAKLATNAVETSVIKDLNVTTGKLAAKAVTAAKIADNTITATQMATGAAIGNIATGAIATAKLADNAVTEAKLGSIKRTLVIRVMSPEDTLTVGSTNNFFPFPVSLNNFTIIDARMNLSVASTSGSVTVLLKNQGGTMTTLTLAAGATGMNASGSISTSYRTAVTNNFLGVECTAAGTGAKGLTVTLVLEGVPA